MKSTQIAALVGSAVLCNACSGEPRFATSGAPFTGPPLSFAEVARIDGNAEDLMSITRAAISENGLLAVNQVQDVTVRVWTDMGTPVTSIGGRGEGPGEFRRVSKLGWLADTLWVYDYGLQRVSYFAVASDPRFIRSHPIPNLSTGPAGVTYRIEGVEAVFPSGDLLVRVSPSGADRPPSPPTEKVFVRVTSAGRVLSEAATMPNVPEEVWIGRYDSSQKRSVGLPWTLRPFALFSGDGRSSAVVTTNPASGDSIDITVVMVRNGQDTVYVKQLPFVGRRIPTAVGDSALAYLVAASGLKGTDEREYLREAHVPPVYPAVRAAHLGTDSSVWIRVRNLEGVPADSWIVVDPSGKNVRLLLDGSDLYVAAVGKNYAWALDRDRFAVPSLVKLAVN